MGWRRCWTSSGERALPPPSLSLPCATLLPCCSPRCAVRSLCRSVAVLPYTRSLCCSPSWCRFVEERDRLALALEGRFTRRAIPLQCQGPQQHEQRGAAAPGQQYVYTQPQEDAA